MSVFSCARVLGGTASGADATFRSVGTDTRTLEPGALYVALRGERFDGHDFIAQAEEKGAAAALVARSVETRLPIVTVADTRLALGQLARYWRGRFSIPVAGITGSNGKTTVKNMLAAILAKRGETLATAGNLNNDIGMPLTLLKLRATHQYAVIEMGMNHPGEIDYLTHICRPTVALITNAAPAHLAGLGNVGGVARAKGEIFGGLPDDGAAIVNADDAFCDFWRGLAAPRKALTFGMNNEATVRAAYQAAPGAAQVRLRTPEGDIAVELKLIGRHNALNAAAAACAARAVGANAAQIKAGLEALRPAPGRLEIKHGPAGATIIDDTYNANPASVAAALDVLAEFPGERVAVLGDMGELGEAAASAHADIGRKAREAGVARLFAVGALGAETVKAFGAGARHFADRQALADALKATLRADTTVLVKGSRSAGMETVVAALTGDAAGSH
jgi:UDP-N-acetylmuramoyl-tripeptide--D-alanyl-D-alanine ligase